jgi:hypothetical protein
MRGWERRWQGATEPYPERAAFQEALPRRASPNAIARARRIFPGSDVLVVADSVQSRIESGFLTVEIGPVPRRALLPPPFHPEFANGAMHVCLGGAPGS